MSHDPNSQVHLLSATARMFLATDFVLSLRKLHHSTWSYTSPGGPGGYEVAGGAGRKVEAQKQKSKVSKKHHRAALMPGLTASYSIVLQPR